MGLAFDGDGDRCGVVDNEGEEIFADKIGVLLARDLSTLNPGAQFVVDDLLRPLIAFNTLSGEHLHIDYRAGDS